MDRRVSLLLALAVRSDACGGYTRATHRPFTRKTTDGDWLLLPEAIAAHLAGWRPMGLHAVGPDNRSRWLAWDIDAHGVPSDQTWIRRGSDVDPCGNPGFVLDTADNLAIAEAIAWRCRDRWLRAIIVSSDGRGGLHVWCPLGDSSPAADTYRLAREIGDGFDVECFPRQPSIRHGGFGNWLRLPGGKHPRTGHRSRVWTGSGWSAFRGF